MGTITLILSIYINQSISSHLAGYVLALSACGIIFLKNKPSQFPLKQPNFLSYENHLFYNPRLTIELNDSCKILPIEIGIHGQGKTSPCAVIDICLLKHKHPKSNP